MPPKKEAPPPTEDAEKEIPEVDEEGPDTASFCLEVSGLKDLPAELETCIAFSGACRENRSGAAAASKEPSGWELTKDKFIRAKNQATYDALAERELVVSVLDVARENAVVGTVAVSLLPLMHERTEVGGDFELKLTDKYYQKWFKTADEDEPPPDPKAKGKAAPKKEAKKEEEEEKPPPPPVDPNFVPPPTVISFRVSVQELVGPPEDRDCWTTITLRAQGVFGLPERLSGLGLAAADDVENHQMAYSGMLLGETWAGALAKPREVEEEEEPPAEGAEGEEAPPKPEIPERERHERFGRSVQFKDGDKIVRYRGAKFLSDFKYMLNHVGGVWFYFNPEEKPSNDPKKPNAPEVGLLAKFYTGKAWLDLSALINRGTNAAEASCVLASTAGVVEGAEEEPTFASSGAYVKLAFEMSHDITPEPEPFEKQVKADQLCTKGEGQAKFPTSQNAMAMYQEAVVGCFDAICRDCAGGVTPGSAGVLEQMRKAGTYDEVKKELRSAVIQVFRERLRKDTTVVPGKPLAADTKAEVISGTYTYLKDSMAKVFDDLRKSKEGAEAAVAPEAAVPPAADATRVAHSPDPNATMLQQSPHQRSVASSMIGGSPEGSPIGHSELYTSPRAGELPDPVAEALAESAGARRTRGALETITLAGDRALRLAYEAEMVGNWSRAAELLQNRLVLEELRREPTEWVSYAKFCARSRGRQAAAEEALRQAVQLLADPSVSHTEQTAMETDLMLACLLLERGREEEALKVFRAWHEKDLADPLCQFLLGMGLFLTGEDGAKDHLEAAGKPRSWFKGLDDDAAVAKKLQSSRGPQGTQDPAPYAACLERLLDFGLPNLVFTFIDQCEVLPKEAIAKEPIVLIDAKAAALDRDWNSALGSLEAKLLDGSASQEAWRLAGECHFQLQDFDKALQAIQQAMSFEAKIEDPAVFIRLGAVLVVKKRWKQARDAFLKSIQFRPTAEAWSGVAYAEYRSDDLSMAYEALCEASLLDNQRSDVWAQLCLVHLRQKNWDSADHCFRQCLAHNPDCDELLLEVALEYTRSERQPALAETAARRSLQVRDSGMGHSALADALAEQGQREQSVLEAQVALRQLGDQPEQRKAIFDRALKLCEELEDTTLEESLRAVQRLADEHYAERAQSPP